MASSYLTRTVTASSATSYTVSFWIKINNVNWSSTPYLWSIGSTGGNGLYLDSSDRKLKFFRIDDSGYLTLYDGALRDCNAWYHIVWSVNSGTGTAYVNGVTANSQSSIPALNNNSGTKINIHAYVNNSYNDIDCCMTHFHFIDGTAYPASTFGETDANGVWKPKTSPSVTYGTNGFFLKFENSGSMGTDSSGNGNNFTVNGTLTQTLDTPSNVYCTLNGIGVRAGNWTLSNGNLTGTYTSADWESIEGTLGVNKGKWYYECKPSGLPSGYFMAGWTSTNFMSKNPTGYAGQSIAEPSYAIQAGDGGVYYATSSTATLNSSGWGDTYTNGDILGCAIDIDNGKLYWSKNGVWMNSGDPTSGATGTGAFSISDTATDYFWQPLISVYNSASGQCNFGNGYFGTTAVSSAGSNGNGSIFEFDCPSGYYALNLKNLATYG